eukprot:scaffold217_cov341-Pavlova_lutheri.AAC.7
MSALPILCGRPERGWPSRRQPPRSCFERRLLIRVPIPNSPLSIQGMWLDPVGPPLVVRA